MTRDEIAQALASIGQHHTHAQRELLQLALRLQNEGMTEQSQAMAQSPTPYAVPDGALEDVLPVVSASPAAPAPNGAQPPPTREQALATAKELLKDRLRRPDQAHLLQLVDRVSQSDVDAMRRAPVQPTQVAETPGAGQSSIEFFRDLFNAATLPGGRGRIGKDTFGLSHYQQDVRLAMQADLKTWPSGFYTDHTSQEKQFMLNQPELGYAILVEGLQCSDIRASALRYNEEEFPSFAPLDTTRPDGDGRVLVAESFGRAFRL